MAEPPDFAAAGLLDGLSGDERRGRLDLLEQLHEAGVSVEEMRRAAQEERLALLPVELQFGSREEVHTPAEVAERTGLPLDFLARIQRAFGVSFDNPDEPAFSEEGLEAMRRVARFRAAGLPEEGMIEVARALGGSMSRLAEAIRAVTADAVRPGVQSEGDLGLRFAAIAQRLAPELGPMVTEALEFHLLDQVRQDVVSWAEGASGEALPGAREVAVGFADLVGFTRLGEERPAEELGTMASRLADLAQAAAAPPVRLVKTIGDAAMLVSPGVEPLLEAALSLVDAAEAEGDEFPQLKAGLASGPALSRGGDWYGHTVNLASRVTAIARPGSVLCTAAVRDVAGEERWRWSFARERRLRNVREPVRVFRVRRREPGDEDPAT